MGCYFLVYLAKWGQERGVTGLPSSGFMPNLAIVACTLLPVPQREQEDVQEVKLCLLMRTSPPCVASMLKKKRKKGVGMKVGKLIVVVIH